MPKAAGGNVTPNTAAIAQDIGPGRSTGSVAFASCPADVSGYMVSSSVF